MSNKIGITDVLLAIVGIGAIGIIGYFAWQYLSGVGGGIGQSCVTSYKRGDRISLLVETKVYREPRPDSEVLMTLPPRTLGTLIKCVKVGDYQYWVVDFTVVKGYVDETNFELFQELPQWSEVESPLEPGELLMNVEFTDIPLTDLRGSITSTKVKTGEVVKAVGKRWRNNYTGGEYEIVEFKGQRYTISVVQIGAQFFKAKEVEVRIDRDSVPFMADNVGLDMTYKVMFTLAHYTGTLPVIASGSLKVYADKVAVVKVLVPSSFSNPNITEKFILECKDSRFIGNVFVELVYDKDSYPIHINAPSILEWPFLKIGLDRDFDSSKFYNDILVQFIDKDLKQEIYRQEIQITSGATYIPIQPPDPIPVYGRFPYEKILVTAKITYGQKVGRDTYNPKKVFTTDIVLNYIVGRGYWYGEGGIIIQRSEWIARPVSGILNITWGYDIDTIPNPSIYYTSLRLDIYNYEQYIGIDRMDITKLTDRKLVSIVKKSRYYTVKISVVDDYDRVLKSWYAYQVTEDGTVKVTLKVTDLPKRRWGAT